MRQVQKKLSAVGRDWTQALAAMLSASLSLCQNDLERGVQQLEVAAKLTARADMGAHSAACQLVRARHLGGEEGRRATLAVRAELQRTGVADPDKLADALIPTRRG